jgi:hypothetical protein
MKDNTTKTTPSSVNNSTAYFGVPVQVNAPPNSQTRTTSGQPYWGFYF